MGKEEKLSWKQVSTPTSSHTYSLPSWWMLYGAETFSQLKPAQIVDSREKWLL